MRRAVVVTELGGVVAVMMDDSAGDTTGGGVVVTFQDERKRGVFKVICAISRMLVHAKLSQHLSFLCDLIDSGVERCDLINFRVGTGSALTLKEMCGFYECIETGVEKLNMYLGTTLPLPPSDGSTLVLEMEGFESVLFGDSYAHVARALRELSSCHHHVVEALAKEIA